MTSGQYRGIDTTETIASTGKVVSLNNRKLGRARRCKEMPLIKRGGRPASSSSQSGNAHEGWANFYDRGKGTMKFHETQYLNIRRIFLKTLFNTGI